MAVSRKLQTWRQFIAPQAPLSASERWYHCFYGSIASCFILGLSFLLIISGVIHKPTSNGIDVSCGYYSDFYGQVFLILQKDRIASFLTDLADVVQEIESESRTSLKVALQQADRSIRRNTIYFSVFYVLLLCSMLPESIMTGISHAPMWPQLPEPLGNWVSVVLFCGSMTTGAGLYYMMWALIFSVLITLTALIRTLSLQLQVAASKREVIDVIKYHQRVKDLSQNFEMFFATHLMHLLASSFLVPLTCTIK
ncbi:Odorant receptor 28, partial [Frankliniella occidentalis]